jgi:hypothetical protein
MTNDSILDRLRAADPVPITPRPPTRELFDQITALPPDPRLARPSRFVRRRGLALALAFAIAALLASTAFAISRLVGGDFVGPGVTRSEYLLAQRQLTLPPGATWPSVNLGPQSSVTTRGAGGGMAVLIAMNAWECYWARAIERGDTAAQRQAHAALNVLLANNVIEAPAGASEDWTPASPPAVPYTKFAHDGGLDWIRASYAAAAAGHSRNLIQSCRANAPG